VLVLSSHFLMVLSDKPETAPFLQVDYITVPHNWEKAGYRSGHGMNNPHLMICDCYVIDASYDFYGPQE